MKLVVCLFLMLISAKECDKKKAQMANEDQTETNTDMTERRMQDSTMVKYRAVSRGYFLEVTLEGNRIVIAKDRDLKLAKSYEVSADDKVTLMKLLSDIDATILPELEAPSKAHQYDGAAIATLEVTKGEDVYKTNVFDHGKPPKAIRALVEKMLLMKDIIDKQ